MILKASRKKNLQLISLFSSARIVSEVFYFFRGMLLAKILGPGMLGIWTQMKISLLFMAYSNMGSSEAMLREVPYAEGQGNCERADNIKRTAWGLNITASFILAIFIFGYFFLTSKEANAEIRSSWYLFVLFFLTSQAFWYTVFRLQSERRIGRSGLMIIGFAAASTLLGTVAAYYWGLPGLLAALVISTFMVLLAGGELKTYLTPLFHLPLFRELMSKGFPIMVSVALLMLLWNVDKIVISLMMDTRSLGIYALQAYITNILTIVPHAVSTVLYPSLMEKIGIAREEATLKRHLVQPTLAMSYLICPLLAVIFIAFPIPMRWFLPQYASAVLPGRIMVFAFFFSVLARMPVTLLVSLNRQNLLMLLTLVAVLSGVCFDWLFVTLGMGLAGVAMGTGLSLVIYAGLTLFFAVKEINMTGRETALFLVKSLAPYLACFILSWLVYRYSGGPAESLTADLGGGFMRILAILTGMAIIYGLLNKPLDLFHSMAGQR